MTIRHNVPAGNIIVQLHTKLNSIIQQLLIRGQLPGNFHSHFQAWRPQCAIKLLPRCRYRIHGQRMYALSHLSPERSPTQNMATADAAATTSTGRLCTQQRHTEGVVSWSSRWKLSDPSNLRRQRRLTATGAEKFCAGVGQPRQGPYNGKSFDFAMRSVAIRAKDAIVSDFGRMNTGSSDFPSGNLAGVGQFPFYKSSRVKCTMHKLKFKSTDLIRLVEQRPMLWDRTCVQYVNKISKDEAWNEIYNQLYPSFSSFSRQEQQILGENS